MANTKTTRDRVAQRAGRLLRKSADPDVLSVAASALAQSDPLPDKKPRRRRTIRPRRRVTAQFKAGKDLITDETTEGGGTE
jgi:superfamily II DNA or RNA helicase